MRAESRGRVDWADMARRWAPLVGGIILLGYGDYVSYREKLDALADANTRFIIYGASAADQPGLSLGCDNLKGGRMATKHLLGLGRRRIAILGDISQRHPEFASRYDGHVQALGEAGIDVDPALTVFADNTEADAFRAVRDFLDSGIEVEALGWLPGVRTADWAETPTGRNFTMAMEKLWDILEKTDAPEPRRARFVCTLCLSWPDGHDEIFEGAVEGRIVWPMRGTNGFGFDPVFLPDGEDQTFGEMHPVKKHQMSHRANAFDKMVKACFG